MGQDIRVTLTDLLTGEWPVRLSTSRVVVVQEGYRASGPYTDNAGSATLCVDETPEFAAPACFLQDAFGREIERGATSAGLIDPINDGLPVRVLVVF